METTVTSFFERKPETTRKLYDAFIQAFQQQGDIIVIPAKTMIGISNGRKRVVYVQVGKHFIHATFIFKTAYEENLCFQKIAKVPEQNQYNHHLRLYGLDDINEEVMAFMKLVLMG